MAAGACTTSFEWSHLLLELVWHKELPVNFRTFLIIPHSPPSEIGGAHPQWSYFGRTRIWCSEAGREMPEAANSWDNQDDSSAFEKEG